MTATTSTTKGFFGKRFLSDIVENKKILIVNFVLELLGLPVVSIIALIFAGLEQRRDTLSSVEFERQYMYLYLLLIPFLLIAIGTILISLMLGFVIALFHFNYLYRKSVVDMHYSLPLSNTQRFFADYLSGLGIYLVPVIISVILSFMILGAGSMFVDLSDYWSIIPSVIKAGFIVIVGMILLYTLSVFSIVFCGSTFEAIFGILALNVMIPSTIACVWLAVINTSTYGMVGENIFSSPIFTSTSPLGAVVFFFMYFFNSVDSDASSFYNTMYIRWMAITLVVIVLYLLVAFLLYKLRKAESVSKPYVYKSFFYIVCTMAVFCIMSLFISNGVNVIPAIVLCAVGWFIIEVITRRGFKKFWTAPIGFTAAVLGVFIICGICELTDGFGASRRVPSALSVDSVTIEFNGNVLNCGENDIEFRDKNVIKAVTEFNKEAVDRHFNYDNYKYKPIKDVDDEYDYYDSVYVEITYQTLYGSTVMREYVVMSSMLDKVTEAILLSDEYAKYTADNIAISVINRYNAGYYYDYDQAIKNSKKGGEIEIYNRIMMSEMTVSLSKDSVKELREAYEKDLLNMTASDLRSSKVYGYLGGSSFWVLESFENTIAFLNAHDIKISPLDENILNEFRSQGVNLDVVSNPRIYSSPYDFFSDNEWSRYYYGNKYYGSNKSELAEMDSIATAAVGSWYHYYSGEMNRYTPLNDELVEVLNNATPIIIGEKPIVAMSVGGYTFYIRDTAENREIVNRYLKY